MPSPEALVAAALSRAEIHFTPYAGGKMHWQRWKPLGGVSDAPVVLLHGGFGSWNHWFRIVEDLRTSREVWTVDLPGLGQSGDMPEPQSTAHFAQIVLASLDTLIGDHAPFALAGFSFGAMIAGQLAVLAGPRCRRCTLIGAVGFGELQVQVPLLKPAGHDADADQRREIHRENLRRLMLHRRESIDELAIYLHGDNLDRHRFRSRHIAVSNELAELLPHIEAPLVGLWGEEDATAGGLGAINARRELFRQAQTDAEFHLLPEVGHWAMYEAPADVVAVLENG